MTTVAGSTSWYTASDSAIQPYPLPGPEMKATRTDSASPTAFLQSRTNDVDASIMMLAI
jgi:hypothetical protein